MRLSSIRIKNFRCYENISLDLNGNLTILVGNNGAGKSAMLDALAVGIGSFVAGIRGAVTNGIDKSDVRHVSQFNGGVLNNEPQYPVSIQCTGDVGAERQMEWTRSLNGDGGRTTTKDAQAIIKYASGLQEKIRRGSGDGVILPMLGYYGTGRLWAHKKAKWGGKSEMASSRADGYIDCLAAESNEKLMYRWFERMTQKELQNLQLYNGVKKLPSFEAVKNAIRQCVEHISDYSGSSIRYNLESGALELIRSDMKAPYVFPLTELSDGYKNTISLVGDIAYRMAVLNPQLTERVLAETPGVVLIDEIDLHLHPLWQQRILNDLAKIFPRIQFIVTTHAPAVIMSAKGAQIAVIKKEGAQVPRYTTYGRDANAILNELMEAGERPAEIKKYFTDFYDELAKPDLEKANEMLAYIKKEIGSEDPDVAGAETALFLEKVNEEA